jgi:molecular chaperone DnaJ
MNFEAPGIEICASCSVHSSYLTTYTSYLLMDKDYYQILHIPQTANEQEIKKAYRQLVMKFHPDRNEGNELAGIHFIEVQEAYEVLSHPARRSAYNQQRWYRQSNRKQPHNHEVSCYTIYQKCRELSRYMSALDRSQINHQALNSYMMQLLSKINIKTLLEENDPPSNVLIIKELLVPLAALPFKSVQQIAQVLIKLAGNDNLTIENINKYVKNKKVSEYWSRYLPLVVLVTAVLLCVVIYYISNNNL